MEKYFTENIEANLHSMPNGYSVEEVRVLLDPYYSRLKNNSCIKEFRMAFNVVDPVVTRNNMEQTYS